MLRAGACSINPINQIFTKVFTKLAPYFCMFKMFADAFTEDQRTSFAQGEMRSECNKISSVEIRFT